MNKLTISQKIALQTLAECPHGCVQSKWTRGAKHYAPRSGIGEINWHAARALQAMGFAYCHIDWGYPHWNITPAGRAALERGGR